MIGDAAQTTHVINESKRNVRQTDGPQKDETGKKDNRAAKTDRALDSETGAGRHMRRGNGRNDREIRDKNVNERENETNIFDRVDSGQLLIVIILFYDEFDYIILLILR